MRTAAACFLAVLSIGTLAATASDGDMPVPLDGEAFRALIDGKTAHFSADGSYYGSEAYYGDNRSLWRDSSGECEEGVWRERGPEICFRYNSVSCWKIFRAEDDSYYAVSREGFRVDFEEISDGPLECGIPLG